MIESEAAYTTTQSILFFLPKKSFLLFLSDNLGHPLDTELFTFYNIGRKKGVRIEAKYRCINFLSFYFISILDTINRAFTPKLEYLLMSNLIIVLINMANIH